MNDFITKDTSVRTLIKQVIRLSIPAILAELTSVVMQYIDSAMVGSVGKHAIAAIGLVSTSTWLTGGLCISAAIGFSVHAQYASQWLRRVARPVFCRAVVEVIVLCPNGEIRINNSQRHRWQAQGVGFYWCEEICIAGIGSERKCRKCDEAQYFFYHFACELS